MATLYITEFAGLDTVERGLVQAAKAPPLADQTVTIAGASAQSSAFNAGTRVIRVHTDAICSILIGTNPTATAAKGRMAADQTEYFMVDPLSKIAVISNT